MKIRNNSIWNPVNRYGNYFLIMWTITTIALIFSEFGAI